MMPKSVISVWGLSSFLPQILNKFSDKLKSIVRNLLKHLFIKSHSPYSIFLPQVYKAKEARRR